MAEEKFRRKLTAILSADVAGYSRLMADDEEATVRTINAYREVMTGLITEHRGRIVDAKGDNVLAEFSSVVDAVRCAVHIQEELREKNSELPEHRKMEFRIGINLGDVIEEEGTIYGDGVNVAARLEGLAEGGGICISGTAFDHVKNRISVGYEYQGKQRVKNIPDPVRVYKVLLEAEAAGKVIGEGEPRPITRQWVTILVVMVLGVVAGGLIWNFYIRTDVEPASVEKMAYPLPDKPSVAVLPFANMSEDLKQEYLADGIAENIISALSKVHKLFVIARNSSFTYKGKPVKVQEIAEGLGVRYILEGSVQVSGDSLRTTAQLIDAVKGHHLWSQRYDRKLKDIFILQDDIAMEIVAALQVKLTDGERARLAAKGTKNLEAYLKLLEAREPFFTVTREGNALARRLLEETLALDAKFPAAYALLGGTYFMDVPLGLSKSPKESYEQAFQLTKKAIDLDKSFATAYPLLGWLHVIMWRQYDQGIAKCEKAIALSPSLDIGYIWKGFILAYAGRPAEAVQFCEQALRLNPIPPGWFYRALGIAYSGAGNYDEAIAAFKESLLRAPNDILTHEDLTVTYSWAGLLEEARAQAAEVLRINPKFSVEELAKRVLYKNQADRDRYLDGLRTAGLPETPPLPLPDKPSIAVLPFVNMSGDPEQEYFSDGISEEIITALSKIPKLFVIARQSSFTYKGKSISITNVGGELGVQYVLEGSVRRAGDKVRITAQLIDAKTNSHLWAERYDGDLKDTFAVQDEITKKIIMALQIKLAPEDQAPIYARGTDNLDAYLKALKALWYAREGTKEGAFRGKQLAEEAIALDPNYAFAHYVLSLVHRVIVWMGLSTSPRESLRKAIELVMKAVTLDNSLAIAHSGLGYTLFMARQYDKAIASGKRAVSLQPHSADVLYSHASVLMFAGRNEEAITLYKEALRLNPKPDNNLYRHFGNALANVGRYEEAIAFQKKAIEQNPDDIFAYLVMASVCSMAGREAEARAAAKEVLRLDPNFSVARMRKVRPDKDRAVAKRWCDTLREAGLPE